MLATSYRAQVLALVATATSNSSCTTSIPCYHRAAERITSDILLLQSTTRKQSLANAPQLRRSRPPAYVSLSIWSSCTAIMPSADSDSHTPLAGGGPASLIILKTHPPLPAFSIPHRVPDPSSDISSLKLSILRILTGQTNAHSSTKPLTFSEEVKEKAINGWKMQMLTLELRQSDDLDEQDHVQHHQHTSASQPLRGFELQDHHECSLIEQGDMIVVRLKPNHTLDELELPELGPAHRYSAPAGSLTRAGTLSEPPPYSIIQPSEPSSFSSSVGAQPNANYHQHRYQDYRSAFRVVTANHVGSGHIRRSTALNTPSAYTNNPASLGQGLNLLQPSSTKANGNKGKRRTSTAAATPTAAPKPSTSPKLTSSAVLTDANTNTNANAAPTAPTSATTPSTETLASSANPSTVALPASTIDQQNLASPPTSPRLASGSATPVSSSGAFPGAVRRQSSSVVTLQAGQRSTAPATTSASSPKPNGKSSSPFASMPATALVIGPGVQGQVGRNPTSANAPIGSYGAPDLGEYGNLKALVGFTSASGPEIRAKPRRKSSRQNSQEFTWTASDNNVLDPSISRRRPSNPATAAADAAERRAAIVRQSSTDAAATLGTTADAPPKRPVKDRQTSSSSRINKSELPNPPLLPPIQNLAPFPVKPKKERDLPPMPMPMTAHEPNTSMVTVSTPTENRPPRLSFLRKFSTNTQSSRNTDSGQDSPANEPARGGFGFLRQSQTNTAPLDEIDPAIKPAHERESSQNSSLTRAERRYLEVQKALATEREKQAEAEKQRADENLALQVKKDKERERKESEAKKRAEEQKWEMWDEVRRRQKAAKEDKVHPGIQRLYSAAKQESNAKPKSATSAVVVTPSAQPELESSPRDSFATATASSPAIAPVLANDAPSETTQASVGGLASAQHGNGHSHGNDSGLGQRIELGLERITRLLARLGSPHKQFPVIHVAGTNGKGTTIAYLDSVLRNALDIRTGTFVSPHLIERRDCCKVDGKMVSKSLWKQAQSDVLFADQGLDIAASSNDDGQPLKSSPFELLTAQTFQAFSLLPESERPEILLIEVGLGGRLDATNVFDDTQVLASVVCPIDRDHEAFLGSKLEGIAQEKAGIIKHNGLCIIADQRLDDSSVVDQLALGPLQNEAKQLGNRAAGIMDSIRNVCMTHNARLVKTYIPWKVLSLPPTKMDRWGSVIDFTPRLAPTLFLSTSGLNPPSTFVAHPHDPVVFGVPVQVERTRANLTGVCMAVQTLSSIARDEWAQDRWEELRTRIMWGLRDDAESNLRVRESINAVSWAGRCSWHTFDGKHVLIDGAHNEASAKALREYLDSCLSVRALSNQAKAKGKSQFEITYILAFSEGKDYEAMVKALLDQPTWVEKQSVALTRFSAPEGMPWVKSVELQDGLKTLKRLSKQLDLGELRVFDSVARAMEWATAKGEAPVVVAGSLYLVADAYRLLRDKGVWSG